MKRWKGLLLACLLCAAACGGANSANQNMAMRSTLLPLDTEPEYELRPLVEEYRLQKADVGEKAAALAGVDIGHDPDRAIL